MTPLTGIVTDPKRMMPLGQMKVADDPAVDLGKNALVGPIGRVVDRAQERVAVGPMENMEQRLVNRFLIGFGSEAILDRAAAKREASSRRGGFHQFGNPGDGIHTAGIGKCPRALEPLNRTSFSFHCTGSLRVMLQ